MVIILILQVFFVEAAHARSVSVPTAELVCKSIDSNKYEAQCTTAMYKATFDTKALYICESMKTDYDKKSCIEVIRNKVYTEGELTSCKKQEKIRIHKCLQLNGKEKKSETPTDESSTTIEN